MTNSYAGSPGLSDSSMPTGALGFVPRRSSYASVVSGSLTGAPHQQPARAGAFSHLLNQNSDFSYDPSYPGMNTHQRYDPRTYDMDFNTSGNSHGRSGSWSRSAQLHPYSSAFAGVMNGNGYSSLGGGSMDHFFIPSYLKGSRYVQKLEEAHKARVAAYKDGQSAPSSQPGSLSTSASSANLHTKLGSSYRGISHDVIEKAPPAEDETLTPLPSKWNTLDKYGGLEVLNDGLEVKFSGPKSERDRDHEACAIRADYPMPSQCGIYYFEVDIVSRKREESSIGIGFSTKNVPLSRLPGWEPESYAYHGDDGHSFCCQSSGKHYGPPFNAGDVIGCGVNFRTGCAFFTKNGDNLGTAFRDIKETKGKLFPSVGMKKAGEHVKINFGQRPFVFDIDGMMSASNSFSYIHSPSFSNPPANGASEQANTTHPAANPGVPSLEDEITSIGRHISPTNSEPGQASSNVSTIPERTVFEAATAALQDHDASTTTTEASQNPSILEPADTVAQQTNGFDRREPNTLHPVMEEVLGPFDFFEQAQQVAREEVLRRQQEANRSILDASEPRPYHVFSTLRTRRGYETTSFTWYHPREATVPRRDSPDSTMTVLPTADGFLSPNADRHLDIYELFRQDHDTPSPILDASDVQAGVHSSQEFLLRAGARTANLTPPTERASGMTSSSTVIVVPTNRQRPVFPNQDQVIGPRTRDIFASVGIHTPSLNHRRSLSRSPHRPPLLGTFGRHREAPIRYPASPRGREAIVRYQQGAPRSADSSPRRSLILGSPSTRFPIMPSQPAEDRSDFNSRELNDQQIFEGFIQEHWSLLNPDRPLRPEVHEALLQNEAFRDWVLGYNTPRNAPAITEADSAPLQWPQSLPSQNRGAFSRVLNGDRILHNSGLVEFEAARHRSNPSHPLYRELQATLDEIPAPYRDLADEQRQNRPVLGIHGNLPAMTEPGSLSRSSTPTTTSNAGDHSTGANHVTVLSVRIPQISEPEIAQSGIFAQGQNAATRPSWTLQEIANRMKLLEIRANKSSQREQEQIRQEIEATSTAKLSPPMDETELVQALILQALAHDGYVETARAFAEEVHAEKKALSLDPNEVVKGFDVKEDEDAGHRQRIRTAVLEGDVDRALKHTNAYYPNVLKDNEHVYFRLRCRKFIEMVRQAAEVQNANAKIAKKTNGHHGDYYDDIVSHDMELDDHPNPGNYDRMDTEDVSEGQTEHGRLLQATLEYGVELQAEFKDDLRREVKKGLDDIFALMAYQDPLNAKQVSHLLDPEGRMAVAEELNSAILLSLGKSSSAALEKLYQQTYVLLEDLREGGGHGALVNIDDFVRPKSGP